MKIMRRFFGVALTFALVFGTTGYAFAAPPAHAEKVDVLVSFSEKPGPAEQALINNAGGKVKRNYHIVPAIAASIPKGKLDSLRRNPKVTSVEEDITVQIIEERLPWGVDQIDAEVVHDQNKGQGVKVAILDTGIDLDHPDLRIAGDVSFVEWTCNGDSFVQSYNGDDDHGHGTMVAGVIAAMKFIVRVALIVCYIVSFGPVLDSVEPGLEAGYVASVRSHQQSIYYEEMAMTSDASSSPEQWYLSRIMAPQAWQITSGDSSVIVAILDTGIDQTHKDLADKVIYSINLTRSPTEADLYGHGTQIAGIIGANFDATIGSGGIAYNCSLMNVKVAEDDGICDVETVAKGIVWAVDNGAKVINISLTITEPSPTLEDAVDYAWDKGAVIIAAAGNNFGSSPMYPAAYPNVIAVAATDKDDSLPVWSNRGDWVSLGAPGVDIYSTLPCDGYGYESGTSPASALVSGEAALLFTIATDTNGNGRINDEVRQAIESNYDRLQAGGQVVTGRINVLKAATAMQTR